MKEMAGEWIMAEPPWWTHFQRPTWLIAMRLRYGLSVTPAIGPNLARRCLAKKKDGTFCLELLDAFGVHACVCAAEGSNIHRHDTIRDGLVPALKPIFTCVKIEQFIFELAEIDDDTGQTKEARMDIVAEMPGLRAMLDVRCFVSTTKSCWKSTRSQELEKHRRYVTHRDGRRCCNMQLFAAVVNTYGSIGQEFKDFCAAISSEKLGKSRGRSLGQLLSLLGVYANAEKVLLVHAPSAQGRAQRADVIAAIAAKDAADAARANPRPKAIAQPPQRAVDGQQESAPEKKRGGRQPGQMSTCPDLVGEITGSLKDIETQKDTRKIQCLACNITVRYNGWSQHCNFHHPENVDDRKDGAKNKDVVSKDPKRKQVSAKCSKVNESNQPSATKKTKKAVSTPQQNSNSRPA